MGCYSDKVKHMAQKLVLFVSIAVFLFAVITLLYSYAQSTGDEIKKEAAGDYADFAPSKSGFAALTLVGGVIALIVSILGCLTAKFKKPFLACPFGFLAGIIALILLIAGVIALGLDSTFDEAYEQACTTPVAQYGGLTGEKWIGDQYGYLVDNVMCQKTTLGCPCEQGEGNKNKELWDGYGEEVLNKYNRTISTASTTQRVYTSGVKGPFGDYYKYSALYFNSGTDSVTNFKTCYDNVMKAKFDD